MTLKEALEENKIQQKELAMHLGVQKQQVSRWVNGDKKPLEPTQRKIDEFLKCKISYE